MQVLVTVDRTDKWRSRKFQVWKRLWWTERVFTPPVTNSRTVYRVDFDRGEAVPLFDTPQLLDPALVRQAFDNQPWHRKFVTRGLRSIRPTETGYVVCDVYGVYDLDPSGRVIRYLSTPRFTDLHSAIPNPDNSRVLVTSTALEEILEVGWDGTVHETIDVPALFGIGCHRDLAAIKAKDEDFRVMEVDMSRHLFHVNWAEWIEVNERMLVSLYVPGMVAILKRGGPKGWTIERRWTYFPKCHGPSIDFQRGTFLINISGTDQAAEVDMESGEIVWIADNLKFGKSTQAIDANRALVTDCNGRRLVEIDRKSGTELRSVGLPCIPYDAFALAK